MFGKKVERRFRVEGMTCDSCVHHVTEALKGVKGVKKVQVDLEKEAAEVVLAPDIPFAALAAAVEDAGYVLKE